MADKPSTHARAAKSAETNEAHDATVDEIPAGTRDINISDSTPSGPTQTVAAERGPGSPSAAQLRIRKMRGDVEPEMEVSLKVKIPSMGLGVGDRAKLPESYAKRLLASGGALTLEDAKTLAKAEEIKAKADEQVKAAEVKAAEQLSKARESEVEAAAKARAEIEERRLKAAQAEAKARKGK